MLQLQTQSLDLSADPPDRIIFAITLPGAPANKMCVTDLPNLANTAGVALTCIGYWFQTNDIELLEGFQEAY
jgi:hypothetical protein